MDQPLEQIECVSVVLHAEELSGLLASDFQISVFVQSTYNNLFLGIVRFVNNGNLFASVHPKMMITFDELLLSLIHKHIHII